MMIMLLCWCSTEFYIGMPTRQSSSSYYHDEYYDDYGRIQTLEIQVLNQTSDSEHFSETQEICSQKYGYYIVVVVMNIYLQYYFTETLVLVSMYLKNDTIFFKVCNAYTLLTDVSVYS